MKVAKKDGTIQEMTLDELRKHVEENDDNLTKIDEDSFKSQNFTIKCSKCGSEDIFINMSFDYHRGSEYTGIYGEETKLLLKCKKCGNAENFIKE